LRHCLSNSSFTSWGSDMDTLPPAVNQEADESSGCGGAVAAD
jgi:hypothetical protein